MFESSVKILLIEDDLAEARLLQEVLKSFQLMQYSLVHVKRLQEGIDRLQQNSFDVILLDLTLPDSQGLESVKLLVDRAPKMPIVVLTNYNDDKLALQAVREGAQDYLVKRHVNVDVLVRSVQYAIERQKASDLLREAKQNLENKVKQSKDELIKAKEINQLQSTLVSMFSHDFRNPLTTVLSCAELLQNKSDLLTEEKKTALFRMIRLASKNMAQLLDEVLLVGRADLGTLECQLAKLDLKSFCAEIVEELQFNAHKKQIEIVFICRGELSEGSWDRNLLRHILGNLLANAIKYSPEGNRVQFILVGEETQVIFRIRDWGIGIPVEDRQHLFEPFHRASNVGRIPGTGLGLAIVQSCVKTCQGQIEINSEVGVGTTVTVTLPLVSS
ncbi:MAG: hybrid sensor histidine kinase/response regulator [Xenococcaceae cyanobacterium MO_188.B32]|nr:hybrid sensor histidine kinase/response regulator [Xenococcaceae cyanobacterium MO_188.B32]